MSDNRGKHKPDLTPQFKFLRIIIFIIFPKDPDYRVVKRISRMPLMLVRWNKVSMLNKTLSSKKKISNNPRQVHQTIHQELHFYCPWCSASLLSYTLYISRVQTPCIHRAAEIFVHILSLKLNEGNDSIRAVYMQDPPQLK